ncbi:MAG: fluoride efflux transporter CrcB [Robiginitalea sp.]|nr:fluoride efflux transporter CrcB [Robiginitalea sp.]
MKQALLIFLGGGMGSVLRYLISTHFNSSENQLYLGTFLVNIIGCLLLGFVLGVSLKNSWMSTETTLLLGAGFCGGFTTFSTFSVELHALLRVGNYSLFFLYLAGSILIGLLCIALGLWLSKGL